MPNFIPQSIDSRGEALTSRILGEVHRVWFWRKVFPLLAVECTFLAAVAVGVFANISVRNILLNALQASSGVRDFLQFFISNFFVKSIQSQLLFFLSAAFAAVFLRDLSAGLRRLRRVSTAAEFVAVR